MPTIARRILLRRKRNYEHEKSVHHTDLAMSHLRRELGILIAVVLMCLGLYVNNHAFFNFSNSGNLLRNISMLGIFAVGIAFVIITGGIDLSVGTLVGLTGVIIAKISSHEDNCWGWPLYAGIGIAMAVMLLIGLVQGLIITQLNLQPFIVTLAGMLIFRGISQTICESGTLSIGESPLSHLANNGLFMDGGDSALISWPVVMFAIVVAVFGYLLHFTVFGRYVFAVGGNRDAAKYSGIGVKKVETMTYVISAGLAGLAGICYASYIGSMDKGVGQSYELYAITAAVLGGCSLRGGEGTVFGVLIGCTMYQVIYNGINMFQIAYHSGTSKMIWHIPTEWTEWIIGGVLLIAVALDQIAHIVQARRRTRKVGPPPQGFPVQPIPTPVVTNA
jgi:ribose transport system permease protein